MGPLFLGEGRDLSSTQIGLSVWTTGLFQILSVPIAAVLSRRLDLRWIISGGFICFALGIWLLAQITNDWSSRELLIPQALRGFAIMFCIVPANTFALGALTELELRFGSGLYNLMRNLGGAIGIAICGTILNDRTNLHYLRLAEHLRSWRPGITQLARGAWPGLADDPARAHLRSMKMLAQLMFREAQVQSFADAFLVLAGFSPRSRADSAIHAPMLHEQGFHLLVGTLKSKPRPDRLSAQGRLHDRSTWTSQGTVARCARLPASNGKRGKSPGGVGSGGLTAAADQVRRIGNERLACDVEPAAQVIPKRDGVLGAGLGETEKGITAVPADLAAGAGTDLAAGDVAADVVLGAVGVQRYLRPLQHPHPTFTVRCKTGKSVGSRSFFRFPASMEYDFSRRAPATVPLRSKPSRA